MMSIRAVITGTGSALSDRNYGSSAALITNSGLVLIDCPDSILRAMKDASKKSGIDLDPMRITDILITHLHGDHVNGLETLGWKRWIARQSGNGIQPRIHAIESVASRLWERLAPAMDQNGNAKLCDYFSLNILVPEVAIAIAELRVEARCSEHLIPSSGFRISCNGATLGWSGDTRFDPSHIDWLASADVIIHETSESRVHTPIACLNALAPELRRKMRLIHMEDNFDQAVTDIVPLTEGEVLEVVGLDR
jgi:ribonuclease BN (tRNA processing enzyme)